LAGQNAQSSGGFSLTDAAFQQMFRDTGTDQVSRQRKILQTLEYAASLDPVTHEAEIVDVLNLVVDLVASMQVVV